MDWALGLLPCRVDLNLPDKKWKSQGELWHQLQMLGFLRLIDFAC